MRSTRLLDAMDALGIETVEAILLTHTATSTTSARSGRCTMRPARRSTCPELEREVLADINAYTLPGFGPFESYEADHTVAGGETLELAGLTFDVRFTPGHSPGHVTYSVRDEDAILFRRRALPGLGWPRRPARRRLADVARLDRVADR